MITGMIESHNSQLPEMADNCPDNIINDSIIKKFERWLRNNKVNANLHFMPYITAILTVLSKNTLYIIFDGTQTGKNCVTLMASVVYKGRSLPIAWITTTGKKGHLPVDMHIQLLQQVHALISKDSDVVFLGDGEFDGVDLLGAIEMLGWDYISRTAITTIITLSNGEAVNLKKIMPQRGKSIIRKNVTFTKAKHEDVAVVLAWRQDCKEQLCLVSNLQDKHEILCHYKKRFKIETLFSDCKSRGFNLQKSRILKPQRIAKLLIVASLAYIWTVFLGDFTTNTKHYDLLSKKQKRDQSLFKIGLRIVMEFMKRNIPLPTTLYIGENP